MPTPLLYLASPYTDPDPAIRQARFDAVCRAAVGLIREGKIVFAPIAMSHSLCQYDLPIDWDFWQALDRRFLEACDEVAVLMLDGWRDSVGVKAEIEVARALGKPVTFLSVGSNASKEDLPKLTP